MNLRRLFSRRRPQSVARFPLGRPGDPLLLMLPPHLEAIPAHAVVGSVSRYDTLDARFRPVHGNRGRLEGITRAMRAGAHFPPIEVYRLGGACYVIDGHHRVAAARHLGQAYLDAVVIECRIRTEAAENTVEDARVDFVLRTGLRGLTFGTPAGYGQALAQIHEHRWYLGERGRVVGLQAAAEDWYETIYLPVVHQVVAARLAPPREALSEAGDLYLRLCDMKYGVSRERGHDIGFGQAINLWVSRHRQGGGADLLSLILEPGIL
jgi:hypothetical protein